MKNIIIAIFIVISLILGVVLLISKNNWSALQDQQAISEKNLESCLMEKQNAQNTCDATIQQVKDNCHGK